MLGGGTWGGEVRTRRSQCLYLYLYLDLYLYLYLDHYLAGRWDLGGKVRVRVRVRVMLGGGTWGVKFGIGG